MHSAVLDAHGDEDNVHSCALYDLQDEGNVHLSTLDGLGDEGYVIFYEQSVRGLHTDDGQLVDRLWIVDADLMWLVYSRFGSGLAVHEVVNMGC